MKRRIEVAGPSLVRVFDLEEWFTVQLYASELLSFTIQPFPVYCELPDNKVVYPAFTTAQRDTIKSHPHNAVIFNLDTQRLERLTPDGGWKIVGVGVGSSLLNTTPGSGQHAAVIERGSAQLYNYDGHNWHPIGNVMALDKT